MFKKITVFLSVVGTILCSLSASAQTYLKPNNSYGTISNRQENDSTQHFPTGCGIPTDSTFLRESGGKNNPKMAAVYYDSCGHHEYLWDPSLKAWHIADSSAGGGSGNPNTYKANGQPGDTSYVSGNGVGNQIKVAAIRDSIDLHHTINPDSSRTFYVQAHDTTSGNALQSKYRGDTSRNNLYASLAGKQSLLTGPGYIKMASGSPTYLTAIPTSDLTGVLQAAQFPALTGPVTTSAGGLGTAVTANAITNAMLAQMSGFTIKANTSGSAGNATDATPAAVTAMLSTFGTTTNGLVPNPGTVAGKVLSDNGTWIVNGSGSTPNIATVLNVGAMSADGTLTTGGHALKFAGFSHDSTGIAYALVTMTDSSVRKVPISQLYPYLPADTVTYTNSVISNGSLSNDTVHLVNDTAAATSVYYGFNAAGRRGFYPISGGSDSGYDVRFQNLTGVPLQKLVDGSGHRFVLYDTGFARPLAFALNSDVRKALDSILGLTIATTRLSGTLQAGQFPALTGQVTTTAGSLATTIASNTVTNSNLFQMAANTFKANNTGSTANAGDITVTQATAMLNTFTSSAKGLVPAPGGSPTGANVLADNGTWIAAGGGGTPANPTASTGLSTVNGSATTYMRSDASPALDVSISPTWTGSHIFNNNASFKGGGGTNVIGGNFFGTSSNDDEGVFVNATQYWQFNRPTASYDAMMVFAPRGMANVDSNQWMLGIRPVTLGGPVALMTPLMPHKWQSFDIMPSDSLAEYLTNGNAWLDVGDAQLSSGQGYVGTFRAQASHTTGISFGSMGFGGKPAPKLTMLWGVTNPIMTFDATGFNWFGKNLSWHADSNGYARYQLLNGSAQPASTSAGIALAVGGTKTVELFNLIGSTYSSGVFLQNTVGLYAKSGTRLAFITQNSNPITFNINSAEVGRIDSTTGSLLWGTNTAVASSAMTFAGTTKGVLFTRLNTTQQNAISSPATGLLIYNTDTADYMQYNGSAWKRVGSGSGASGSFYQTVQLATTPKTQRAALNFNSSEFVINDNSGNNSTDIGINTLYSADGTLAGNRTVSMGTNTLAFTPSSAAANQVAFNTNVQFNNGMAATTSYISGSGSGLTYTVGVSDYIIIINSNRAGTTIGMGTAADGRILIVNNQATGTSTFSGTAVNSKGSTITTIAGSTTYTMQYSAQLTLWIVLAIN